MSNIGKQAVQAVADLKAGYTLGHADVAILNELARIALASLEAEPVCVIDQSNLDYLNSGSDADVWPASRKEMGDVLLYRAAPPASVSVPDGYRLQPISEYDAMCAAMLQGAEPVMTAYKLPEGWVAVPVEPTEEMIAAAMCSNDVLFDKEDDTLFRVQHGEIWRAMLSTAPQQEAK